MVSRFLIVFLPRSKCLLIPWLQSPYAVILEPKNIKSLSQFPLFPHPFPHLFTSYDSHDQNTAASASGLVPPMRIQHWSPLRLTGFISLLPKLLSGVFSNTAVQKHPFFGAQFSLCTNSHIHT